MKLIHYQELKIYYNSKYKQEENAIINQKQGCVVLFKKYLFFFMIMPISIFTASTIQYNFVDNINISLIDYININNFYGSVIKKNKSKELIYKLKKVTATLASLEKNDINVQLIYILSNITSDLYYSCILSSCLNISIKGSIIKINNSGLKFESYNSQLKFVRDSKELLLVISASLDFYDLFRENFSNYENYTFSVEGKIKFPFRCSKRQLQRFKSIITRNFDALNPEINLH